MLASAVRTAAAALCAGRPAPSSCLRAGLAARVRGAVAVSAAAAAASHRPLSSSPSPSPSPSPHLDDNEGCGGGFGGFGSAASPHAFRPFRLSPSFVDPYRSVRPPFGFNGLGEFVFQTRYSRVKESDGTKEGWTDTCERVVNGTFSMQKRWLLQHGLGWDARAAQAQAREMFDRIFTMKFLPPGRGLWAMGTPMTEERFLFASLNNCAFVSTQDLRKDPTQPFTFLMDAAMLGVGVGFDTDGAGTVRVAGIDDTLRPRPFVVPDCREGWVESLRILLDAHFSGGPRPVFDYGSIRPRGTPIKGFGGSASGGDVLERLHRDVESTLHPLRGGRAITVTAIVDIMNQIGRCVVSGDVRQTAEIAFGDPTSDEYVDLKDYAKNPGRAAWGWTSNNSVYATLGMPYDDIASRIRNNGEPGFAWLENMRGYSRMREDERDFKDRRAKGGNPCLEQTLESYELCCLVETFPNNHESFDDFAATLRSAFLYAKTVTLGRTHWPATNRVMLRNRRIGCSVSGVAQFIADKGLDTLRDWCERGYRVVQESDERTSDAFAVPRSIKTTCVKPSGTVSLLAGATPGMHYPESRFYLRRVRVGKDHEVVAPLRAAGYHVEPAVEDPDRKVVVTFPVDAASGAKGTGLVGGAGGAKGAKPPAQQQTAAAAGAGAGAGAGGEGEAGAPPSPAPVAPPSALRTLDDLTMWEQFSLAAFLQRHWADNQVSCTITFDPEREGPQVARALDHFQYQLKGVSLLPRSPKLAYKQLPYEAITEEEYRAAVAKIARPVDFSALRGGDRHAASPDKFCDTSRCDVDGAAAAAAVATPLSAAAAPKAVMTNPSVPSEEAEDLGKEEGGEGRGVTSRGA
jgi:ribonucleoside-triphosphate reductase (thioredoxin)